MAKETNEWPISQKLKKKDGTVAYVWDGKLHNWEGPALIPEGNTRKAEYYLYGVKMDKDTWSETRRQREGVPYYKNQSMKSQLTDYRN